MHSIWEEHGTPGHFPALERDISTDVLIIGGGICGLLCVHRLREVGVDCVLVEADRLCSGITKNTTAKITAQHGLIYHKVLECYGLEQAKRYLQANQMAVEEYVRLCRSLDCDFQRKDAYVYARNDREKLREELETLALLGQPAEFQETVELPLPTAGAIRWKDQAQFHPLKFAAQISRGLPIYEHTKVHQLLGTTAQTSGGTIRAKRIVVATHFPFLNKHGSYFLKLYQHRSYVLALKHAPQLSGMYVDEAQNGMSFRNYGDLLLVGGGDHRTGKQGGAWQELRAFVDRQLPEAAEVAHWATQDCMSLDGIPYIGPYSAKTQGLYVATGFNKWGMTSSMVAAMVLTDQLQGKENPWSPVFSPSRTMLHPQLAVNAWEAAVSFLTPTTRRCPHLGCALHWNPQEHSWDCPCHGSRFSEEGSLIDNPAANDLNRKR